MKGKQSNEVCSSIRQKQKVKVTARLLKKRLGTLLLSKLQKITPEVF